MFKHIAVLLRYIAFWLAVFFLDRLAFVIFFNSKFNSGDWKSLFLPFIHGLRLDFSMAAYLSLIPLLFYLTSWYFPKLRLNAATAKTYTFTIIILSAIITVVNLNVYREWGTKFNYRALYFAFSSPNEAIASSYSSPLLLSTCILILLIVSYFWLSRLLIVYQRPSESTKQVHKLTSTFCILVITFLMIRGGWQLSPINQSMAYYSQNPVANHAAVNTTWNLLHDISKNMSYLENPFQYMDLKKAQNLTEKQYPDVPANENLVLSQKRPNVVLIILESFHADLIESLGGEKNLTPETEKIIKNGILFDQIYAAGERTDKGTIAILSAFPSQAVRSIIKENGKQEKLPAISQVFKKHNYQTSFYYGGESEFFGLKSYVLSHGYDKLIDKNAFESKDMNSKWGAYDEKVYEKQLLDLNHTPEPFFSTLLTLTNHEPFEVPGKPKFPLDVGPNLIRNTAFYTDSCLGAYLKSAKKSSWYKNTLFVIVADHGHRLPRNKYEIWHPRRFQIPLILFGEVIKPEYRGVKFSKTGGQTDLAKTLLNQLGMKNSQFKWSKDLFNEASPDFAFFTWDNGLGWVEKDQSITFDNVGKTVLFKNNTDQSREKVLLNKGKAYLQTVYQTYLDY